MPNPFSFCPLLVPKANFRLELFPSFLKAPKIYHSRLVPWSPAVMSLAFFLLALEMAVFSLFLTPPCLQRASHFIFFFPASSDCIRSLLILMLKNLR